MGVSITNRQIQDELRRYEFEPTVSFCEKTRSYIELLQRWNRHVSLTTVTSPIDILRFHFGESLFAISCTEISAGRLADVGSGAGFPGMPLAMAVPNLDVTVIESNAKKAAFLAELQRTLALENVHVHHGRTDTLDLSQAFDSLAARAVGSYAELLGWARTPLRAGGRVLLWLGARQVQEISRSAGWHWQNAVSIPGTKARFIIVGSRSA